LKVLPDYVFIGVAKRDGKRKKTQRLLGKDTKISLYANADKEIVIVRHRSHLEKLLLLASFLDETSQFEISHFGCELQRTGPPKKPRGPVNLLFVSPRGKLSLRLLEEEVGEVFGQLFRMFGEEWVLLYAMNTAIRQDPIFRMLQKSSTREIIGLTKIWEYPPKSFEQYQKKNKYDPIRAKTRELEYQMTQARSFIVKELDYLKSETRTSQRANIRALNHRFILIRKLLEAEKAKIDEVSKPPNPSFETIEEYHSALNSFGSVINTLKSDPYCQQTSSGWIRATSQLLESVEILSVEDAFVLDAHNTLGMTGLCPIIIPSKDYNCRVVHIVENMRIIELPITISPRLGLLPIVYHLVAHQVAEEIVRSHIATLPILKKIVAVFMGNGKNNFDRGGDDNIVVAREILADLISAEIAGPAYLYALSRAFPFEQKLEFDGYQELKRRLNIISNYLCKKGFSLSLDALPMDLEEHATPVPENISELISTVRLSSNYSQEMHKSMLARVKPALIAGEVTPIKPSLVANALWDAVLDGKNYLNENAAFLSVLKWLKQKEAYVLS
jgi:hypothetical protein